MRASVLFAALVLGTLATALPYRSRGAAAWWRPAALQSPWSDFTPRQNTEQLEHHYDTFDDHSDDYSTEDDYEEQHVFGGHGLDRRISDDLRRFEEDLVLLRRLVEGHHQMGMVPMFHRPHAAPWYFPSIHVQPQAPGGGQWEEEDTPQDGPFPGGDKGAGNPWFSFPSPANHPLIPAFPKPEDFPDNYDNSSHTVHVVNGSHVTVNTTTKKNSDDDFHSFFHHQVVHIRPEGQPKEEGEAEEPTDEGDEGEQMPENEHPEAMSTEPPFVHTFPQGSEEPPAEVVTDGLTFGFDHVPAEVRVPEVERVDGVTAHTAGSVRQRSASYTNHLDKELPDRDQDDKDQPDHKDQDQEHPEDHPPPDLSSDTLVNQAPQTRQGPRADPDAEILV